MTDLTILLLIGTYLLVFILGWNLAVRRHRAGRRQLTTHVNDLEQQVAAFNEERQQDPQRGWTNVGARYALNQIEQTVTRIRADLESRTHRPSRE